QALDELPAPAVPTVAPLEPGAFAATVQLTADAREAGAARAAERGAAAQPAAGAQTATGSVPPILAPRRASIALAEHADPELVKLFIEEAREELDRITRYFPAWDGNPLEQGALATVRRSFHTLKGSGRMVGARDLAELAWSIENLLNRLLDSTLTRSPAIVSVVREAIAALPELIDQLDGGAAPRVDFASIETRAHSLAAGRETAPAASADDAEAAAGRADDTSVRGTGIAPGPTPIPSGTAASKSATDVGRANARPPAQSPSTSAQPLASDDALREIFARETAAHIAVVRAFLARERGKPAPRALPEEVYRACHTLSGSSKMAEARHGVRLAQPLDHWLRKAFDSGIGLSESDLQLVADSMSAMEGVAAHLDESTGYFASHFALCERIAAAEKALDGRIAESVEAAGLTGEHPLRGTPAGSAPAPAGAQALAPPLAAVELPADFDPEVASIFTEEATELIEAAESALTAWRGDPSSTERLAALKRPLHTLKGGARMAGITAMGDLSHELETLVNQIDGGGAPRRDSTFDALQSSLDALASMRDSVAAGRGVAPARDLIARLRALAHPGGSDAFADASAAAEPVPSETRAAGAGRGATAEAAGAPDLPGAPEDTAGTGTIEPTEAAAEAGALGALEPAGPVEPPDAVERPAPVQPPGAVEPLGAAEPPGASAEPPRPAADEGW
ncbi:MAG: Hpt domain-containing protein, partial [Steroidobacteraceae bacterium]